MISIDLDSDAISNALSEALAGLSDGGMGQVMASVGEYLLSSTVDRIGRGGPAPDGTPGAPKAESTYQRYVASGEGVDRRPLIHIGFLNEFGLHRSSGSDFAELGVSALYGMVMQA